MRRRISGRILRRGKGRCCCSYWYNEEEDDDEDFVLILRPHSASSSRPLRSLDRLDLLVPHSRTALAQTRSFASTGRTLWNALSPSVCSTFLAGSLPLPFSKPIFCTLAALVNGSCHQRRYTNVYIQYNIVIRTGLLLSFSSI